MPIKAQEGALGERVLLVIWAGVLLRCSMVRPCGHFVSVQEDDVGVGNRLRMRRRAEANAATAGTGDGRQDPPDGQLNGNGRGSSQP
jgi:hypothetical protein